MTPSENMFALRRVSADLTLTGSTAVLAAPGANQYYIIRTLVISSDTAFTATPKSGTTRIGPKIFCAANAGVALDFMSIKCGYNEAFNIDWTGGGNGGYYVEYQLIG